jgi:hypothetical protein
MSTESCKAGLGRGLGKNRELWIWGVFIVGKNRFLFDTHRSSGVDMIGICCINSTKITSLCKERPLIWPITTVKSYVFPQTPTQAPFNKYKSYSLTRFLYSSFVIAIFKISSTLFPAFFGSFATCCQISPCFGSAIAILLSTSSFFSGMPCCSKNL